MGYDVFFSYNWRDRETVEQVARSLREKGLKPFLDRWYLVPGRLWPKKLEELLCTCGAVAIFLGPHGLGRWQAREMYVALSRQAQEPDFPVIPVLLPGAEPALSFLTLNTWVDLRQGIDDPLQLQILAKAIWGEPPGPDLEEQVAAIRAAVCPYKGLRAFREEDAEFFFGRDGFAERLLWAVRKRSLVAVVGASGSGKSSVVFAGLVPRLRRLRPPEPVWELVSFTPGDRPYHRLAAALLPPLEPEMTEADRLIEVGKLAPALAEGSVHLRDVVERVLEKQPGTDRLLIVADQFEELYTLTPDGEARRFVDHLLEAAQAPGTTCHVALTLRGDFYGRALSHRPLADALQDNVLNLGPMTREELEQAVRQPARKVGLDFEPGLDERILDDVGEEPGNLPLLEFALMELWNRRRGNLLTHEAYEDIGRVQGAIAARAEAEYGKLRPKEQEIARRVFVQLVRPGEGTEDTRRRATLAELTPAGADREAVHRVVKALADARLVVTGREEATGEETVEVAHEALIRGWGRLREWMEENRAFRTWQERLRAAIRAWEGKGALLRGALLAEAEGWLEQRGQDLTEREQTFIRESIALQERERAARERLRRRITAGLAAGLIVTTFLAFMAWGQRNQALEQRKIAVVRHLAAQAQLVFDNTGTGLVRSTLLAVESMRRHPSLAADQALRRGLGLLPCPVARMEHEGPVYDVAFGPDGRWVVSGSGDGTVRVWEAATGEEVARMEHEGPVSAVAFGPDGRWVVSGSGDGTVRIWEAATGEEVARMEHEGPVSAVAFGRDGRWVASGSEDNTLRIWLWKPEDLIAEACRRLPRNLTRLEWRRFIGDEPYRPTCPNLRVPE